MVQTITFAPTRLRTEHLVNPIGIDARAPRLSWVLPLDESRRGTGQTGYQIQAATTAEQLASGNADVWDSGRVVSDQSVLVGYGGPALSSRQRVWWRVRVWDDLGETWNYSEPAFWEMGLLEPGDWTAQWVCLPMERDVELDGRRYGPPPYLRKTFTSTSSIANARVYVTARGLYRLSINGHRVGSDELCPGWTDYKRRIQYQTYDVTDLLRTGENAVGAIVGDGWYCGYVGMNKEPDTYGDKPELLVQLMIEHTDGSVETIVTDSSWRASRGPIDYADLLAGERHDARRAMPGWDLPGFDDSGWTAVQVAPISSDAPRLVAQPDMPVRVTEEVAAVSVTPLPDGRALVDFGQNLVGRVNLSVSGTAGTKITLRHAEILQPNGEIYIENLRAARQTDEFILSGGQEVFEPLFTFHGFRYVEVSGCTSPLFPTSIFARVLESETEVAGRMETGSPMVNQLISNIEWGQRGNFLSIPTDCPQRDERLGWMGDAQVFVRTATYNRNVAAFFTKWLTDVRDAQSPEGAYTDFSPTLPWEATGAAAWADAGIIVPWTVYLAYGDRSILEASYDSMARFVDFIAVANPDGIWRNHRGNDYGDWLSNKADTPKEVLATAYLAYDCVLMSRIATILGKDEDARAYDELFTTVRDAFNCEFVRDDGTIHGETQTVYVLALHMDLLPDEKREAAARHLVRDIEERGTHLSTGFIGVGYLCPVLTEAGYADVAYKLLLNETFPSWGYSIAHGATTIWERWDGWTEHVGFQTPGMNSFNHYSLGSVGEWLYRHVAGIDADWHSPGFKHIVLQPHPSPELGELQAFYAPPYGDITSSWRYTDAGLDWDVTVPSNTSATAYIPTAEISNVVEGGVPLTSAAGVAGVRQESGRVVATLSPGRYTFSVKM